MPENRQVFKASNRCFRMQAKPGEVRRIAKLMLTGLRFQLGQLEDLLSMNEADLSPEELRVLEVDAQKCATGFKLRHKDKQSPMS